MGGEVLVEIDEQEQFNEGVDLSGILTPVICLEEDVDHDGDELTHVH